MKNTFKLYKLITLGVIIVLALGFASCVIEVNGGSTTATSGTLRVYNSQTGVLTPDITSVVVRLSGTSNPVINDSNIKIPANNNKVYKLEQGNYDVTVTDALAFSQSASVTVKAGQQSELFYTGDALSLTSIIWIQ
jgi:hypothetical protein